MLPKRYESTEVDCRTWLHATKYRPIEIKVTIEIRLCYVWLLFYAVSATMAI